MIARQAPRGGLRDLDSRTIGGLFLALVAAILGVVPGWHACFAAWLVLSWLLAGCAAAATLVTILAAAITGDGALLRAEGRRLLVLAVLVPLLPLLGALSTWVELAPVRAGLCARADASARGGGPRLAITVDTDDLSRRGFLYDAAREIDLPPARRSPAWTTSDAARLLVDDCASVSHLAGPYYRWVNACAEQ